MCCCWNIFSKYFWCNSHITTLRDLACKDSVCPVCIHNQRLDNANIRNHMSDAIKPRNSLGAIVFNGKSWNMHKTPLGLAAIPSHVKPHELAEAERVLRLMHASRRLGNGNVNEQTVSCTLQGYVGLSTGRPCG